MSKLSRREIILLLVLFVVVVFAAYYYFIYQPMLTRQADLRNDLANIQTDFTEVLTKVNQIDSLEKRLADLKKERQERLDFEVRQPEEVLTALDFFARQNQIIISQYEKAKIADGYSFKLNLSGDYFQLLNFFRLIDNWDYRLVVENFTLQNYDSQLELDLSLFFYQPDSLVRFSQEIKG